MITSRPSKGPQISEIPAPSIQASSLPTLSGGSSTTLIGSSQTSKQREQRADLHESDTDTEDGGLFDEGAAIDNVLNGSLTSIPSKPAALDEEEDCESTPVYLPSRLPAG